MLRDEAVEEIKIGLKFRTDQDALIISRMQRVQRLLEMGGTLPWFLLVEGYQLSVAADDDAYMPPGFIRESEVGKGGLYYQANVNEGPVFLRKMDRDEAFQVYGLPTQTANYPVAYSVQTDRFKLWMRPTTALSLYLDYYKQDDSLANNIENKWLANAPEVIIGNAGASVAKTLGNKASQEEFEELARVAWQRLLSETILRQTSNRTYYLGRNA